MKTKILNKTFALLIFVLLLFVYIPKMEAAATATLYLSPGSLSRQVGSVFTVNLYVNSGGQSVNAFKASVNAPGNILAVTGASSGGSICNLFIQQPTVVGNTVSFQCGRTNGFNGNGKLISVSYRAVGAGRATVSINNASVKANDGLGSEVLAGTAGGTYTTTTPLPPPPAAPASTAAPAITSSTHPNQDTWYKNGNIQLNWSRQSGVSGFSYVVDQNPGTVPAAIVNTSSSSLSVNKGDGVWYLHVRARGANGWSSTSHFRIQIDTSPPANLIITSDPKKDADRRPMISFNATDAVSGIAGYQLAIDKSEFKPVSSPYIPSTITSGNHTFTVRAFDKAGNMTEGKYNLYIKEVPKPVVTSPADGAMIKIGEKVTISGTGASGTLINIYFDGLKINKEEIKVDENGRWSFTYDALILPGKHNIVVVAVRDGIESQQSDQVNLRVDPSAVDVFGFIIPSYFVFIGLIFISLILLSLLILTYIYLRRKFIALVKRIKKEEEEIKSDIQSEYASMERELRKEVDTRKGNGISDEAGGQLESSIDEDVYDSAKRLIGKVNEKEANLPEEKNPLEAAREKVIDILKKPEDKE